MRPASSGILENQLSKYQVQLADWCACPSGKTPDGKKKIAALQSKVDAIKVQLQQIQTARARRNDLQSATAANAGPGPKSGPAATLASSGGLIDVTA
jgi:hypothetical protein